MEGVEEDGELEVFLDCEEEGELVNRDGKIYGPILSLQAMWRANSWETMKLQAKIGEIECVALLDSGSSHNFLSWALVKKNFSKLSLEFQWEGAKVEFVELESTTDIECQVVEKLNFGWKLKEAKIGKIAQGFRVVRASNQALHPLP
ncbi:hypothetical protein V6N13_071432 [Hibiscus sabdariffa]